MLRDEYISIIVPVYNVEKYLVECIQSVLSQTYPFFELILVDDGSKDSCGTICDEWSSRDNRVKAIHKKNEGLVSAWSAGLYASIYNWIVFLDADDWIETQHLEKLADEQRRNNADIVVARMKQIINERFVYLDFVADSGNYCGNELKSNLHPIMLNAGGFEKRGVPVSRCSKLIKKSLLLKNMCYCSLNTTYEEDLNIMFPTMLDAESISLIREENAAYCYRWVEDSMLHGYDRRMHESIDHVYKSIMQVCEDKAMQRFLPQVYAEYLTAMVRCYANELQNPKGLREGKKCIRRIAEDKLFQKSVREVNWSNYPIKFKIIIYILKNCDKFYFGPVTWVLLTIKKVHSRCL